MKELLLAHADTLNTLGAVGMVTGFLMLAIAVPHLVAWRDR